MLLGHKRQREEFINLTEKPSIQKISNNLKEIDFESYYNNNNNYNNNNIPKNIHLQEINYVDVDYRSALYTKPKCYIRLEDAPDGLPHFLSIDKSFKISHLIEQHLGTSIEVIREEIGDEFYDNLISLERALHTKSSQADIIENYFLPDVSINKILGPTVLARILNGKSPRLLQTSKEYEISTSLHEYPHSPSSPSSPTYLPNGLNSRTIETSPAYAPIHSDVRETKNAQLAKKNWLKKQEGSVYLAINIGPNELQYSIDNNSEINNNNNNDNDNNNNNCNDMSSIENKDQQDQQDSKRRIIETIEDIETMEALDLLNNDISPTPTSILTSSIYNNDNNNNNNINNNDTTLNISNTTIPTKLHDIRDCISYRRSKTSSIDDIKNSIKDGVPFLREDICSIGKTIIQNKKYEYSSLFQTHKFVTIAIDIRRVLIGFSTVANILHIDYHSKNLVHCDLTPTNILVLSDTFLPIDSMNIPFGSIAPGGTLEWSAPEQILYKPVSDKTDVYSLALMIVALLGGSMFGQIVEYVVASRPQNLGIKKYSLDIVKLLPSPELTLGNFEVDIENTGIELSIDQLRLVLKKSLQLDPLLRPTILELSQALIDFAHTIHIGPECILNLNTGFGEGNLYYWKNDEGIDEYFWKSSYKKSNLFRSS